MILEAVGDEPLDQVEWFIEGRHRPDVRDPVDPGEECQHLGESSVEGSRRRRPGDAGDPVPEWLAIGGIMKEDGIAEIADLSTQEGVGFRLVPGEPADIGGGQVRGSSRKRTARRDE